MATFKVGQRVRVIASMYHPEIAGMAGAIYRAGMCGPEHWVVDIDGIGHCTAYCSYGFRTYELAPLTDPNSEWASSAVKKLVEKCKTQPMEIAL